jgi:hypothetical protein
MLLRLSLIVAIIAGLAVGGLNFVLVKDKVTKLAADRDNEKRIKEETQQQLAATKTKLDATEKDLSATKTELASTKDELAKTTAEADAQRKRADSVTADRDKIRRERDTAQEELARYHATELQPEQILAMNKQYKALEEENRMIARKAEERAKKIDQLKNRLAIYEEGDKYIVPLPVGLKGKILVTDPKWNFVVLDIGQDQGVKEFGELLVNRDGKLVAKVKVRSVQKDRSIANVMTGWQLGEVMEGDLVIPAHPEIIDTSDQVAAAQSK